MKSEVLKVRKSRLEGTVNISGAKNNVLKLLAASILTDDKIIINNYPTSLLDAQIHVGMLEALGKKCIIKDDELVIEEIDSLPSELFWDKRSIRNTLLILGTLLTRTGKGKVPLPGGCKLGDRKYDLHVMIFEAMGAKVWEEDDYLIAESKKRLVGTNIYLPLRSTGATENAILCGVLAEGKTTIWGPHIRPEILDMIVMLQSMGAIITVHGQESIIIEGVAELRGCRHRAIPDNMEALTWLIAGTITDSDIEIKNFPFEHLEVPLIHLRESGSRYYRNKNALIVRGGTPYPIEISTGPYPGINSDMQPLFAAYAAHAQGVSKIVDLRFHNRYAYITEFEKMGISYKNDNNVLEIDGRKGLQPALVNAIDLRAGAALLIAALATEGETVIQQPWMIMRGYDKIVEKLKQLGGNVELC